MRHTSTGDLGWLVRRAGQDKVRLDRSQQEILIDYEEHLWTREHSYRPISRVQVVQVAFEADRALLKSLGEHDKARKSWHELTEKQRKAWIEEGPQNPPKRAQLYKLITECLEERDAGNQQ